MELTCVVISLQLEGIHKWELPPITRRMIDHVRVVGGDKGGDKGGLVGYRHQDEPYR